MLTREQVEAFMPSEKAIKTMHARYPIQGTFIMDQMMGPHSSAGWFLAGYLFGRDAQLRGMGFEAVADLIAEGNLKKVHDA